MKKADVLKAAPLLLVFLLSACASEPDDGYSPIDTTGPREPAPRPARLHYRFSDTLSVCQGMTVRNGPRTDVAGHVADYSPTVEVNGVELAVAPSPGVCISSGFGTRDGRLHKGVDYWAAQGNPILAAGPGVVAEMTYRSDYGNMIVLDHGHGVYNGATPTCRPLPMASNRASRCAPAI